MSDPDQEWVNHLSKQYPNLVRGEKPDGAADVSQARFRCDDCGRFVSREAIDNGRAVFDWGHWNQSPHYNIWLYCESCADEHGKTGPGGDDD